MSEFASTTEPLAAGAPAAGELTVAAYLERWLAHTRGRVRVVTYEGYETLLRLHALPRIGRLRLEELRPLEIQDLYGVLLVAEARPAAPVGEQIDPLAPLVKVGDGRAPWRYDRLSQALVARVS